MLWRSLLAMAKITPIILAGGSGTRLWPLSTKELPKQFLPLLSEKTLFQETIARVSVDGFVEPIIVGNASHKDLIAAQLCQVNRDAQKIFLEPIGRNTAPAIAIVAMYEMNIGKDPLFLVLPADHAIKDQEQLKAAIALGTQYAEQGKLVTFGIKPSCPETGYGYIKCVEDTDSQAFVIEKFVEKPNLATAEQYLRAGYYYWNSGMFMFRASAFLAELQKFAPEMHAACEKVVVGLGVNDKYLTIPEKEFSACPNNSIDYAVMEHTTNGIMVNLDAGWSDVGSWQALWEYKWLTR